MKVIYAFIDYEKKTVVTLGTLAFIKPPSSKEEATKQIYDYFENYKDKYSLAWSEVIGEFK